MSQAESAASSATSRSSKFNIDENAKGSVLVYQWRGGPTGLAVQSQADLAKTIDKNTHLRCSRKQLPRGKSRIDVRTEDLYNEPERTSYSKYPNMKNCLASIGIPSKVYWKRMFTNQYKELFIISPESSPENSPENSQNTTPSSTFAPEARHAPPQGQEDGPS
ncbi:hypothetical protein NA57DRAFT_53874 [Rhizodiscina lignyota]|uniref:Uncharacterized protein n=1 Tax=Rhizodiscina lignyota TaxID=1504668 RepID=A0A9P4ILH5_9PEZI|nr:hypothetical protein NA57DRAFT_53874 [Rhizodiscina lignyota]